VIKDYELAYVDSRIARLKMRRKLIAAERSLADLRKRASVLMDQINAANQRSTPDSSAFELADLVLTRKLDQAQTLVTELRGRASIAEKDLSAERARHNETRKALQMAIDARTELALEVTDRVNRAVSVALGDERNRITAWLRTERTDALGHPLTSNQLADEIEKGFPS
jgi:hypothetical protein